MAFAAPDGAALACSLICTSPAQLIFPVSEIKSQARVRSVSLRSPFFPYTVMETSSSRLRLPSLNSVVREALTV